MKKKKIRFYKKISSKNRHKLYALKCFTLELSRHADLLVLADFQKKLNRIIPLEAEDGPKKKEVFFPDLPSTDDMLLGISAVKRQDVKSSLESRIHDSCVPVSYLSFLYDEWVKDRKLMKGFDIHRRAFSRFFKEMCVTYDEIGVELPTIFISRHRVLCIPFPLTAHPVASQLTESMPRIPPFSRVRPPFIMPTVDVIPKDVLTDIRVVREALRTVSKRKKASEDSQ